MKRFAPCLALLMTLGFVLPLQASTASEEATRAAIALGLGRPATAAEMKHPKPFASTITELTKDLAASPDQHRAVAARALSFVYGHAVESPQVEPLLFADIVAKHLVDLSRNQPAYQQVLQRAYQQVIGRDAYVEEIEYWSKHPTLPYALLVGCIEDWARRNQPGLMNTSGTPTISINCELLNTVRVSPQLAPEIDKLLGLPTNTAVLAPGGTGIKSSGDIRFVVIGAQ